VQKQHGIQSLSHLDDVTIDQLKALVDDLKKRRG
jgi:hypothetical protein